MRSCSLYSSPAYFIFTFTFTSVLHSLRATAQPHGVWHVDILTGPAPPPDEGPPLSAGALRDRSKLKYEVVGIVGAYLCWLLFTLVLLLFVGKKLRRKTQTSNQSLSMEILRPAPPSSQSKMSAEPPLKSPGKMASLRSWASGARSHTRNPSNVSASTVDERILEADKARNLDEMARLYAAVMAHDEQQSEKARSSGQTSPRSPISPQFPSMYNAPPTPRTPGHPPTPKSPYYQHPRAPVSPRSPKYPMESQDLPRPSPAALNDGAEPMASPLFHPLAPTPAEEYAPPNTGSRSSTKKSMTSALSHLPGRSNDPADKGKRRPSAISVRGQAISQPLVSAALTGGAMYSSAATMSPRVYNPGPPPPTPGQNAAVASTQEMARTPGTAASNKSATLPFRQFYKESMKSAPATKTTFLDRRESVLGTYPRTGVPQTPYSPYMPFTPMTPVTPRSLVTKKEMKKNRKKEGLKVLSEDDMVKSDEDIWGD